MDSSYWRALPQPKLICSASSLSGIGVDGFNTDGGDTAEEVDIRAATVKEAVEDDIRRVYDILIMFVAMFSG